MVSPEKYQAKCIKMDGMFNFYQDPETGNCYFACIISDATACCSQGLEFVLSGDYKYPDDYPPVNSEITVTGIFETFLLPPCFYCNTDSLLSMAWLYHWQAVLASLRNPVSCTSPMNRLHNWLHWLSVSWMNCPPWFPECFRRLSGHRRDACWYRASAAVETHWRCRDSRGTSLRTVLFTPSFSFYISSVCINILSFTIYLTKRQNFRSDLKIIFVCSFRFKKALHYTTDKKTPKFNLLLNKSLISMFWPKADCPACEILPSTIYLTKRRKVKVFCKNIFYNRFF